MDKRLRNLVRSFDLEADLEEKNRIAKNVLNMLRRINDPEQSLSWAYHVWNYFSMVEAEGYNSDDALLPEWGVIALDLAFELDKDIYSVESVTNRGRFGSLIGKSFRPSEIKDFLEKYAIIDCYDELSTIDDCLFYYHGEAGDRDSPTEIEISYNPQFYPDNKLRLIEDYYCLKKDDREFLRKVVEERQVRRSVELREQMGHIPESLYVDFAYNEVFTEVSVPTYMIYLYGERRAIEKVTGRRVPHHVEIFDEEEYRDYQEDQQEG